MKDSVSSSKCVVVMRQLFWRVTGLGPPKGGAAASFSASEVAEQQNSHTVKYGFRGRYSGSTAALAMTVLATLTYGCLRVKSDPVKVEPIHITVDVNVRMEREVRDFFRDIDKTDPTINPENENEQDAGSDDE